MLGSITYPQFLEWQEFFAVDYFGEAKREMSNARLMALIANVNRDPKKTAYTEKDFFPYPELLPKPSPKATFSAMKTWAMQYNALTKGKK
jgi:hypothetical protein